MTKGGRKPNKGDRLIEIGEIVSACICHHRFDLARELDNFPDLTKQPWETETAESRAALASFINAWHSTELGGKIIDLNGSNESSKASSIKSLLEKTLSFTRLIREVAENLHRPSDMSESVGLADPSIYLHKELLFRALYLMLFADGPDVLANEAAWDDVKRISDELAAAVDQGSKGTWQDDESQLLWDVWNWALNPQQHASPDAMDVDAS